MTWVMLDIGAPTDPIWRTAAKRAGGKPGDAFSIFTEAICWRKTHDSLARFVTRQLEVMADFLDISLDQAQRLWRAFVDLEMVIETEDASELRAWRARQGGARAAAEPRSDGADRQARWRRRHPGKRYGRGVEGVTRGVTQGVTPAPSPDTPFEKNQDQTPPPSGPPPGEGDTSQQVVADAKAGSSGQQPTLMLVIPGGGAGRGTRLPADFTVPADWLAAGAAAREEAQLPAVGLALEATKFVNYWSSRTGPRAIRRNWSGMWINWCLNAKGGEPRNAEPTRGFSEPREPRRPLTEDERRRVFGLG